MIDEKENSPVSASTPDKAKLDTPLYMKTTVAMSKLGEAVNAATEPGRNVPILQHELSKLFPPMREEEMTDLVTSIRLRGLLEPITKYQDKILDGWNRYLACGDAGVTPTFVEYEGDTPAAFVLDKNRTRRHLKPSQWALVGTTLLPLHEAEAEKRMLAGKADPRADLHQGSPATEPIVPRRRGGKPARARSRPELPSQRPRICDLWLRVAA